METNATSLSEAESTDAPMTNPSPSEPMPLEYPPVPVMVSPPQMVAVRRRRSGSKGKRRSRSDKLETPQRRAYIAFLCFVLILMAVAAVKGVRKTVYAWLHSISPALEQAGIGLEVVALVLAGLILVYLMPGMEERILRLVGVRRDKRR